MYLSPGAAPSSVPSLRGGAGSLAPPCSKAQGAPPPSDADAARCCLGAGIVAFSVAAARQRGGRRWRCWAEPRAQDLARSSLAGAGAWQRPATGRRGTTLRVFDRFREDAITAIYCAQEEAIRQGYGAVCTEMLLLGIVSEEQKGAKSLVAKGALTKNGITKEVLGPAIANLASAKPPANGNGSLNFSDNTKRVFDLVNAEKKEVGCEQLLLVLLTPDMKDSGAARVLTGLGVSAERVEKSLQAELERPAQQLAAVGADEKDKDKGGKTTLDEVGVNLSQMAEDGLLDPVIGREEELQRVIQVLLRRRKNNACLVGPPGVGKTAVAEGLAQLIAEGKVPPRLRGKTVYSVELGSVVAGTKYRGEFEERFKNVIQEATDPSRNICLFIDEIHQLVGAGMAGSDSSMDAANLLKPALARGELQVVGATTSEEYAKHIEKDAALERRFQKVSCDEPSVQETVRILEGLRPSYEEHHNVLVAPEALGTAARLASRHLADRFLPDKAIDLLDEAGSLAQLRDADKAAGTLKTLVTPRDIATVLSKWSGVPVERLTQDESARIMRLEERLGERIIGQGEAVSALGRAVRRARAGLTGTSRPIASLYFAGPTGVGKTELCKVLASEYYSDPKAMVRLDMSEYSESHSVSRLVGPPPGYVGYDDPRSGQLTEAVRRRPYSVVVLDEIEKAHPEVLNLLLQVLEDGRLTDGKGRTVPFKDCIVIMTSNVGSREILEQSRKGGGYAEVRDAVMEQLQARFPPEFINRLDELLVFRTLTVEHMRSIAQLLLRDAARSAEAAYQEAAEQDKSLASTGLHVSWSADLVDAVLARSQDVNYGARPLRRAVQRLFEDPVAELLVGAALAAGGEAQVDMEDGSVVVRYRGATLRPSHVEEWSAPDLEAARLALLAGAQEASAQEASPQEVSS